MSNFQCRARDAIREAEATKQPDRKAHLLALAEAWLELADHAERTREIRAEIKQLMAADELLLLNARKGAC